MKKFKSLITAVFIILIFFNNKVLGQVATPPANTDPGSVLFDIKEKQKLEQKNLKKKKEKDYKLDTNFFKELKKPDKNPEMEFYLEKINFSGNSVVKDEKLKELSKKYEKKTVKFENIIKLTNEITDLYREKGYLTTIAYIPPQKIKNNTLKIQIAEGKVGNIKIQGNKWVRKRYIEKNLLKSRGLEEDKIFNVNELKQSIQNVNSKEYLKGNIELRKGLEENSTDIYLDVEDRFPLDFGLSWNNFGRQYIGKQRAGINTTIENLTGYGDSFTVYNSLANGTYGLNLMYSLPIGHKGTMFNAGYSLSRIEMGGPFKANDIEGSSQGFNFEIMHPFWKKERYEIRSFLGFDFLHSETTIMDQVFLNKYESRVIRTGLNGFGYDSQGFWSGELSVSAGLPILGATLHRSAQLPDSNFVKINTNYIRYQRFPLGITGILKTMGQYSPMTLLSSEQLFLGGSNTVRGFAESVQSGDYGYSITLELRSPIPFLPKNVKIPYWNEKTQIIPIKNDLKFVTFYDQGWTHITHQGTNPDYKNFLQSIGVGLRYNLGSFSAFTLSLGIPLGKQRFTDQKDVRVHFSLSADLI